jgi:LuxR family maltose regulon positive regulatory protein
VDPLAAIIGAFVLADIKMALGQLHAAMITYEKSIQLAIEHGEPMPLGTEDLYTGISKLHRERGDLEAAAQALLTGKKLGEKIELPDWQHRWCIAQARLKQSQGDLDGALDLLRKAVRQYVRTPVPEMRPIAAMKARVWVGQGRLAEALDWSRERDLSVDDDLSYQREFEHITLARLLIAQHRNNPVDSSLHEVMGLVERVLQAAEEGGRMGSVIEILVLQALAYQVQGDIPPALLSLERALTLAEPEGYLRIFVDEGPPVARLLYEAVSHGIVPEYIRRLLGAFPVPVPEQSGSPKRRVTGPEWIEPLSERETEVLQLIAEGLTNQEIASRLFISLNTVKVHSRNIYGKLGVHHRTSAVARARALGFLPVT